MSQLTRRTLLLAGVGGVALLSAGASLSAEARDRAIEVTASRSMLTAGTTIEQVASAAGLGRYRRLMAGPGYPLVVREELCTARSGRDSTRTGLASIVQFTDLHLVDAQAPMRFEYLLENDRSGFRPQESLGTQAAAQLVKRVNDLRVGPFSGRIFDCVVSTGDNSDNNEFIELDWFLTVMNGGTITANTGDASMWEGVQTTGRVDYYNPDLSVRDVYKQSGYPTLPGFFRRATTTHTSDGLNVPWYSVFGNHDDSIGGTIPASWAQLEELYTGTTKFTGFVSDADNAALVATFAGLRQGPLPADAVPDPSWQVAPDDRRAPFTAREFITAHLAEDATGPGPVGHGFTSEAADTGAAYYTFPISEGVTGISLDSTNRAGFTRGSLGEAQFRWLEGVLAAGSSHHFSLHGDRITHRVDDQYFVLFSHHTSRSMTNLLPDPASPGERRRSGDDLIDLLHRFPNVLAWVNGHSHQNAITAHPGATPARSFWEINTASHIDFPQQARIIDVCSNGDGTLSLFTTLIESAAPYQASYEDDAQASLASLYRELSFNDPFLSRTKAGTPRDQNTELLLVDPLA